MQELKTVRITHEEYWPVLQKRWKAICEKLAACEFSLPMSKEELPLIVYGEECYEMRTGTVREIIGTYPESIERDSMNGRTIIVTYYADVEKPVEAPDGLLG